MNAGCWVKIISETLYSKRSVGCMSGDIYVKGCVHVHVTAAYMSTGLSVQMAQEALQMSGNIICVICMSA